MRQVAFLAALALSVAACSTDPVGETVTVEFRVPDCRNGSIIELDGESYQAIGTLPQSWKGLDRVQVEVTASTDDRLSVEDQSGEIAEFSQVGDEMQAECVPWPDD